MIQSHAKSNLPAYLLIGFLQGITGYLGTTYWHDTNQLLNSLILGLITGVAVTGLSFQLLLNNRLGKHVQIFSVGLGLLYAAIAIWLIYQLPDKSHPNTWGKVITASWIFSSPVLAYILFPFIQSWPKRRGNHYNYSNLYEHSWDNFFIFFVAGLLAAVYWLLIVLWAKLFKILGITLFEDLFFSAPFAWFTLPVVFSLGIRIGLSHEKVIGTLRHIALSLCHLLMPLTAVITILFAISLPFTGMQPIWDTGYSTPILLCLIGANILFINGVFQDGTKGNPYNLVLSKLVDVSLILMPAYALIAFYSTYLRIDQYGLTPKRVYLTFLVLIALSYSFSYSWAVIKRSDSWLGKIKSANTIIALVISILIVLIHSPILNPVSLSANNQYKRLINGRVSPSEFDFGALRFQLGAPGYEYLQKLKNLPDQDPMKLKVSDFLQTLEKVKTHYQWKKIAGKEGVQDIEVVLKAIISGETLPDGFTDVLRLDQCRGTTCYFMSADLNRDNRDDIILIEIDDDHWDAPSLYVQGQDMLWARKGDVGNQMSPRQLKSLVEQLGTDNFQIVDPKYQSIKIGDEIFNFVSSVERQ
jgi:hypothetical protein